MLWSVLIFSPIFHLSFPSPSLSHWQLQTTRRRRRTQAEGSQVPLLFQVVLLYENHLKKKGDVAGLSSR